MLVRSRRDQLPAWLRKVSAAVIPKRYRLYRKRRKAEELRRKYEVPFENIFGTVNIETHTDCNYRCHFCPQGRAQRPKNRMSQRLFDKIVGDLGKRNYAGRVGFQVTDEPLLDERLCAWAGQLKAECPECYSYIVTNGALLTEKNIRELFESGISLIYVNDYTPAGKIAKEVQKIAGRLGPRFDSNVQILHRGAINALSSRGGNALSLDFPMPLECFCFHPFDKLVIGCDGRVVLCCMDYFYKEVMGDAEREDLYDIWFGDKFERVRAALYDRDRTITELCRKCDYVW